MPLAKALRASERMYGSGSPKPAAGPVRGLTKPIFSVPPLGTVDTEPVDADDNGEATALVLDVGVELELAVPAELEPPLQASSRGPVMATPATPMPALRRNCLRVDPFSLPDALSDWGSTATSGSGMLPGS
jgi:hypothetical protein